MQFFGLHIFSNSYKYAEWALVWLQSEPYYSLTSCYQLMMYNSVFQEVIPLEWKRIYSKSEKTSTVLFVTLSSFSNIYAYINAVNNICTYNACKQHLWLPVWTQRPLIWSSQTGNLKENRTGCRMAKLWHGSMELCILFLSLLFHSRSPTFALYPRPHFPLLPLSHLCFFPLILIITEEIMSIWLRNPFCPGRLYLVGHTLTSPGKAVSAFIRPCLERLHLIGCGPISL